MIVLNFVSARFPFVAADILTSNKTIAQALAEGGWEVEPEKKEEEEDTKESSTFEDKSENTMVQSILANAAESENKGESTDEQKKECLVETLEQELDLEEDSKDKEQ